MYANIFKYLIFKTFSPFNDSDDINITMIATAAATTTTTTTTTSLGFCNTGDGLSIGLSLSKPPPHFWVNYRNRQILFFITIKIYCFELVEKLFLQPIYMSVYTII